MNKDKWSDLKELVGYIQNGSAETVTLSLDEATHTAHISVGKKKYCGDSLDEALSKATKERKANESRTG